MKAEKRPNAPFVQVTGNSNHQQTQIQPVPVVPIQPINQSINVNWKWITIDPELFKDVSVPCIIRENDEIRDYVCVRIIEKTILSYFEKTLSEEAKNFGILNTYSCTSAEIFILNDINDNHVDKLYGSLPFTADSDTLVSLKQFLEFYKIVKRTCKMKSTNTVPLQNHKVHIPNKNYQPNYPNSYQSNYPNNPQINNQIVLQSNQQTNNFQQLNMNMNMNMNNNQYTYNHIYDQRVVPNMPNMTQFSTNQFLNYPVNNPQLINRPIINGQQHHQFVQLYPQTRRTPPPYLTPVSSSTNLITTHAIPIPAQQIASIRPNYIQQIQRPIANPQLIQIGPQTITVNVATQNRNLTPPLTPMMSNQAITRVVSQNQETEMRESKEIVRTQIGKVQGVLPEVICLDNDDIVTQNETQVLDEIDFTSDEFGFVQINEYILPYTVLNESFYRFDKLSPKCHKYLLTKHLVQVTNLISECDLKKNLTIVQIENSERIKQLINWFNKQHKNQSLPVISESKLELVNLIQFQFVFAKTPIFFKDLFYLNKPEIKYYSDYKDLFELTGGLIRIPNEDNKKFFVPFIELDGRLVVSVNIQSVLSNLKFSEKIKPDQEIINLDPSDVKNNLKIKEFFRLQLFYTSLNLPNVSKKENKFYDLKKWVDLFPNDFEIMYVFNSKFPQSWLSGYKKVSHSLKQNDDVQLPSTQIADRLNTADTQQQSMDEDSVYMSPLSDTESVDAISLAVLDQLDNDCVFNEEDLKTKPRLRSYSQSSALSKFNTKINFKRKNFIKYSYIFKRRYSCTALDNFEQDSNISKEELVNGVPIINKLCEELINHKNLDKKLSKTLKINKTTLIVPIKQEETEIEQTVLPTPKKPIAEVVQENNQIFMCLNKKQIKKACEFIKDSPSRSNQSSSSQIKRKISKINNQDFQKRARLTREEKAEIIKDINFVVPDDQVTLLKKNEHFNYTTKKNSEPQNLSILNKKDLYSTDVHDIDYYIKKYKINVNCEVRLDKIDISSYLKKIKNKNLDSKKTPMVRKKKKIDKPKTSKGSSSSSSLISSTSTDSNSNQNDDSVVFFKPTKLLRIESDDELPRLDI